jgi:predicted 2-oxoglutarate/Fe(II)-dependent dioxygenase YbiX
MNGTPAILPPLPAGYTELAAKMPPPLRALLVENAPPSTIPMEAVLDALGMPTAEPTADFGLRSLTLLGMLPKPTGSTSDVLHVSSCLDSAACAALRAAVDRECCTAADSVDGQPDFQLNMTRTQLEQVVGADAVGRLWRTAIASLRRFRGSCTQHGAASVRAADETSGDCKAAATEESLPEAHEIFVRRYTATTRPWFPFHKDRSELTINVALSDDAEHGGGRLIALLDGEVRAIERGEGCATIHPSSFMHAVSRMTNGARYSLIIFFGRNERIMAFNQEVKRPLGARCP